MKASKAALVILLLVATFGLAFTIAQQMVSRNLAGTVTIRAEGNFVFHDSVGAEVGSLQYGELGPGESGNVSVFLVNSGNTVINVTGSRIDDSDDINVVYRSPDGAVFNPQSLKLISPGGEVAIVIEVWSDPQALGEYSVEFLFTSEDA